MRPPLKLGAEERLATGDRQRLLEARGLRTCHFGAECCELVATPTRVSARSRFFDQPVGEQPFDNAVQGSGAQADGAVGEPNLRLVEQLEFAAIERARQLGREAAARLRLRS